jgi:hypothetical protein
MAGRPSASAELVVSAGQRQAAASRSAVVETSSILEPDLAINLMSSCTYPSAFLQVGYHHNDGHTLFPNHSPVIVEGRIERPLSADVGSGLVVALQARRPADCMRVANVSSEEPIRFDSITLCEWRGRQRVQCVVPFVAAIECFKCMMMNEIVWLPLELLEFARAREINWTPTMSRASELSVQVLGKTDCKRYTIRTWALCSIRFAVRRAAGNRWRLAGSVQRATQSARGQSHYLARLLTSMKFALM